MMAYFRCFDCNKIWTKLHDDGCNKCGMPCEVLNWDRELSNTLSQTGITQSQHENQRTDLRGQSQDVSQSTPELIDYRPRRLLDFNTGGRFVESVGEEYSNQFHRTSIASESATSRTRKESTDSGVSIGSPSIWDFHESSGAGTKLGTSLLDNVRVAQRGQQKGGDITAGNFSHNDISSPPKIEFESTVSEAPVLAEISQNKDKKKKKSKKNRKTTSGKKQSGALQENFVAQLELPDPVPLPTTSKTEQAWNKVVNKRAAKKNAKLNVAPHRGFEVDASPSIARRFYEDGNEYSSARVIGFGMRGAKHNVKSTVPGEVFDF